MSTFAEYNHFWSECREFNIPCLTFNEWKANGCPSIEKYRKDAMKQKQRRYKEQHRQARI